MFVDGGANGTGYLAVGTPVSALPKGSVTYKGFAEIVLNSPSGAAQTGNFELSLNFSGSGDVTGSLSASTNDYMMVCQIRSLWTEALPSYHRQQP